MKYFAALVAVGLWCLNAFAQSPAASTSPDILRYRTALNAELERMHAQWLYANCDVFRRVTENRVQKQLGLDRDDSESSDILSSPDVSHVADVSRSSDDENETTVAISRGNPNLIVAASNDVAINVAKAYVTTDAGISWKTYRLPDIDDSGAFALGDPQLTSDDNGEFYYAFLIDSIDQSSGQFVVSDLMVARSSNGRNWSLGKPVVGNFPLQDPNQYLVEDKETIAVDRNPLSPYHGRLYIAWTEYSGQTLTDFIAHSEDSGRSWSTPVQLPEGLYGFFGLIRIGRDGTVYIGSSTHGYRDGMNGLYVSHDGGETFDAHEIAAFTEFPTVSSSFPLLKSSFRSFPYCAYDIDLDSNILYVASGTYENDQYAALYLLSSSDEGKNWSEPVAIGDPALLAADHYQPWVAFDPIRHETYVSYYSSEEDQDSNMLAREHRVTVHQPSAPMHLGTDLFNHAAIRPGYEFVGDYCESDAFNGTYVAVWTQKRKVGVDGDVFGYVSSPAVQSVQSVHAINAEDITMSEPYPNPSSSTIAVAISSNEEYSGAISLYDASGRCALRSVQHIVPEGSNAITIDASTLRAGIYRLALETPHGSTERSVVILK